MPLDGTDRWVNALSWMTEGGLFADSNGGAHADPVAEGIATLPLGWRERLICIETPNLLTPNKLQARAWVLEPHDLLASKYVAGRSTDYNFCEAVIRLGIIDAETLRSRLRDIEREHPTKRKHVEIALAAIERVIS